MSRTRSSPPRLICLAASTAVALSALVSPAPLRGTSGAEPWDGPAFAAEPAALLAAAGERPAPPNAEVEVLLYQTEYTVEASGLAAWRERQVYRILTAAGLDGWSSLEVAWSPWYQERPVLRARVITAGGRVHVLDEATVADAASPAIDPEIFDDERLLRAPLPAVAVGAVVETEVAVTHRVPYFEVGEVRRHWLAMTAPVRRARMILDTPADLEPAVRSEGVTEQRASDAGGRRRRTFEAADVAAVTDIAPGLPPEVPLAPYVAFATGASWRDVARAYSELVDEKIAATEAEAASLAAFVEGAGGGEGPEAPPPSQWQRVGQLTALVHREVRYTGLELDEGGIVPRSPAETLARRFGDCKDKAVLLVALLRREGIPAYVALLAAGSGPDADPALPGLGLFNHTLVYLPGASPLWIDATDPYSRPGELPALDQGRWALVASPNTRGPILTPEASAADNRSEEVREIYLAEIGNGRVVETSRLVGGPAWEIRASWDGAGDEEIRASLADYAAEVYGAGGVAGLTHTPLDDPARELVIELEVEDAEYAVTDLTQGVVVISLVPLFQRLPDDLLDTEAGGEPRPYDYLLPEVSETVWRVRIHIPPNLVLRQPPESAAERLGPAAFERSFELSEDGRLLAATFRFATGKRRWTPEEVEEFRAGVRALDEAGKGSLLVWFDQTVQAHVSTGRLAEAVAEARRLVGLAPESALPRAQLARALLASGLGPEARRAAAEAAAAEPEAAVGHKTLAWILVHDEVGRHFRRGYDRAGAEGAYRRALELEPDDSELLADLAILLEHDDDGVRYSPEADLAGAIELYRRAGETLADTGTEGNLLVALLWAERYPELRREVEALGDLDEHALYSLAAAAVLDGPAAALAAAARRFADPSQRLAAVGAAARQLMLLRRYREAAALFRGAGRDAPGAAVLLSLAETLERTRRHEEVPPADDTPSAVVRSLLVTVLAPGEPDLDAIEALSAEVVRRQAERPGERERARRRLEQALGALRQQEVPRDVVLDLALSAIETREEGDDATGYRVEVRSSVGGELSETAFYVVREGEAYRVLAAGSVAPLGLEVLDRLERGDLAAARAWLDRAWEASPPGGAGRDPLAGRAFARFWHPGEEASPEEMRRAAGVLLAEVEEEEPPEEAVTILAEGRREAPESERLRFDLALAQAHLRRQEWKELRQVADRLLATEPGSETALRLAVAAREALGDAKGLDRLAEERLAEDPEDRGGLAAAYQAALVGGDLERAAEMVDRQLAAGVDRPGAYNEAAWLALVMGEASERALERARQGAERSGYRSYPVLHTLSALYAELGQPAEAYRVLLQGMEVRGGEPDSTDWYVFGRLAEHYGLPRVAESYYRRVERPEREHDLTLSTWALADRRLRGLPKRDRGR